MRLPAPFLRRSALAFFAGLLHSIDASCMQQGPLAWGISGAQKREYGWVCCDSSHLAEPSGW